MYRIDVTMNAKPIKLGNGVEVTDAVIRFKRSFKEVDGLYLITTGMPDSSSVGPIPASETGDKWYASNEHGVWWGFNDGPVGVPADASPVTTTVPVEHEQHGSVERVPLLTHYVTRVVNNEYENAITVTVNPENGYLSDMTLSLSTAKKILERYINGSLGSDVNTHHRYEREIEGNKNWASAVNKNKTRLKLVEAVDEYEFVEADRQGWTIQPVGEDVREKIVQA